MNQYRCSIVVCARWETADIGEWLTYHASIGFDHVYLYCNDDDPTALYTAVLPFVVGARPFVTFIHFPFLGQQRLMYLHFLRTALAQSEWVTFLDVDEFLWLPRDGDVGRYLARVGQVCDVMYINWLMFGNNGHVERPGGSTLEQYTRHEPSLHPLTKLLVRTRVVDVAAAAAAELQFWHGWPASAVPVRSINVFGEAIGDYYEDFPQRATARVQAPGMLERALGEAVICHFTIKSEADFERRAERSVGGEFRLQTTWAERHRSGEYKDLLVRMNEREFTGLRDYWRALHDRAAIASVVGAARGPNLALGRPATQSSVSPWSLQPTVEADAAGAVSGRITGGCQFHTADEMEPWWQVDLGAVVSISEVRLFNRLDAAGERARHLRFTLSYDGQSWREVFRKTDERVFGGMDGFPLIWTAQTPVHGRLLRVGLIGRGFLHLDQVEVYG